ncbi:KRAB-A domain-containing protein 2 [Trichinella nativa]|uniref:KRAB-A domain-containing protein 2 n=1 Tax=Trichinella nativa TaxID=6335 RepID=A0A0V1KJY9_9BILA|nr:KRAB-A domain-containing protein 2 [Trichinella nativa]
MDRKAVFEEKLRALIKEKGHNGTIFPTSQGDQIITDILRIQSDGPKSARDYNLKNRYGVLKSGEENKLIRLGKNEAIRCIAFIEEIEAQNKWANVTQEACHLFLTFCEECHKKRARKLPKSLFVKPLVSTNLMSRSQVDLINFQTMRDGDFKYIMTYLNHFTKFCILSPLKSKRAEEVASKLLEIFLTFGAPSILQSDNGREFSNAIIAELKTYWPELKLVTGRPRHPQSQGAVERLNGVVQDKLAIWMRENGCKRWSMGLKFVQWQINVSVHETTGQSPFKVTFGEEPRIGLESYILPKSLVDAAKTEELIEEFLTSHEANNEDSLNRDGKNYDENESSIMKHLPETFIKARKEAALGQTRAAAKMTRRTKKMLIPLKIGQNCTVRVPDVDRGPADPKNFLVVVMAECEGLYTVGCREGKLASKFTAADLQVISENLLSIDEVPDTEIPLRTAVIKATGGQGYIKCMCLSCCSSGRCSCSRKRVLCNSRCHPGKSCNNI